MCNSLSLGSPYNPALPEGGGVAVEEVLPPRLVIVITKPGDLLGGPAEAQLSQPTLGEPLQSAPGKCVAVAPDVNEHLQRVVHHIRSLRVTKQLGTLEVHPFNVLSLWDLSEEAVQTAVIAADRVGAEVMVGVADDGHDGSERTAVCGLTIARIITERQIQEDSCQFYNLIMMLGWTEVTIVGRDSKAVNMGLNHHPTDFHPLLFIFVSLRALYILYIEL